MMILNYKPPKKIIRKYTDYWTNKDEIEFILYDLPVECTIRGFDLEKSLEGVGDVREAGREGLMP